MQYNVCVVLCACLCIWQQCTWTAVEGQRVTETIPLLPYFNNGLPRVLVEKRTDKMAAALGNGQVTWSDGEDIQLRVDYYCAHERECHGEFSLNGSQQMMGIDSFDASSRHADTHSATARLVALHEQGFALVGFRLTLWKNTVQEGYVHGQYMVHLKPPEARVLTKGCTFKVTMYSRINLMVFEFDPTAFMPSGLLWHTLVLFRRVRIKKWPDTMSVYVPILVMRRSPFSLVPLNFYYFRDVVFELGDNGRLFVKGTTAQGMNQQNNGVYTVRWFYHNRQHIVDESCENTGSVQYWANLPPLEPIFAHSTMDKPEQWSFNIPALQKAVYEEESKQLVACVWTDVFQKIPKKREFTLATHRYAFYSEGEDLGFLMYAYVLEEQSPSLEKYVCSTESMEVLGIGPYRPCPQNEDAFKVYPHVSIDRHHMRFTIRGEFTSKNYTMKKGFHAAVIHGPRGRLAEHVFKRFRRLPAYERTFESMNVTLPMRVPWRQGMLMRVEIHQWETKNVFRAMIMDADNKVHVNPMVATHTQPVEIKCLENRLGVMATRARIEYVQVHADLGGRNYVLIGSYTPQKGARIEPKNIDSSARLIVNVRKQRPSQLRFRAMAFHMHRFHGFRCRVKTEGDWFPLHEVVNKQPVCFVRRPPPVILTVDNSTVPPEEDGAVLQHQSLKVYQTSCIRPGGELLFTCSEWREIGVCDHLPRVENIYKVDTDLIIHNAQRKEYTIRKPVFDRFGRGQVKIATVPYDWHLAEVTCRRKVYLPGKTSQRLIVDQYSSVARLCVSRLKFSFYVTHVGIDKKIGLTMNFEELKKRNAVNELNTRVVNTLTEGSAVICTVSDNTKVTETKIKQHNTETESGRPPIKVFSFDNVSIAILLNTDIGSGKNTISIYCQTKRSNSQITAKSDTLRLTVREAAMKEAGSSELRQLFGEIITTTVVATLIAGICPLIVMVKEVRRARRHEKRRAEAARKLRRLNYLKEMGLGGHDTSERVGNRGSIRMRLPESRHRRGLETDVDDDDDDDDAYGDAQTLEESMKDNSEVGSKYE
ncbi:unnamed protein product [Mesocestoides corti]|uniref:Secreted protein n=1 Tax=Mesocestoides corti TaxID=53468 RepID=A0A0R3UKB1_MESCO|nr:unnamed protein product [Mesocestoides corti]